MVLACFSVTEAGLQCFLRLTDESYFPLSVFIGRLATVKMKFICLFL